MLKLLLSPLPALALACASASGTYAPIGPEHPASAQAVELPIQDPSASLRAEGSANAAPEPAPAPAEPAKGAYVCPMHPAVTADEPGRCPECGMELVPRPATQEHPHDG